MTKAKAALLVAVLALSGAAQAASMAFREGGGSGQVDLAFDDTYINVSPADNSTHGNQAQDGLYMQSAGSQAQKAALLAVKDLFTSLPRATGGLEIQIQSAQLRLVSSGGSQGQTVYVNRVLTDWLPDAAGQNENDVSGLCRQAWQLKPWAGGGAFSQADWSATVTASAAWLPDGAEAIVDVTALVAGIYRSGRNHGLVLRCGDGFAAGRASEHAADRPVLTVAYAYGPAVPRYALTVNSGSGGGSYTQGLVVDISADAPVSGKAFNAWTGDVAYVRQPGSPHTTVSMPGMAIAVTATYRTAAIATLTVVDGGGSGQYAEQTIVAISAAAPSGQTFDRWLGDVANVDDIRAIDTTIVMPPADAVITASFVYRHALTVVSGSGSGDYGAGEVVEVAADPASSGYVFNMWIGDPKGFAGWNDMKTALAGYTMPDHSSILTATYRPASSPMDWWPYFDAFCKEEFGAEVEPLAYEMFGNELALKTDPNSQWRHISETSACLAFETNLPAKGRIEYGPTDQYGSVTPQGDRYHYLHTHYLKELTNNTTYHYRFIAEDERGNVVTSDDNTFTTATPANVVYVPGSMGSPPYVLNSVGKTYLLTQDIVANRTAFNITANNITLDLGGHTVVYNQENYQVSANYRDTSPMGVRGVNRTNIKILNGTIKQGLGYNTASTDSLGYSPVTLWSCSGELAGISADYAGVQITGFKLDYSTGLVTHHNVLLDRGGDVDDRHQAPRGMNPKGTAHHNLILRHRQIAMDGASNSDFYDNEIYVDSCATNAAGIMLYGVQNAGAYGNRIFGTGYLVLGISTVSSGIANVMVHDNFIHLQAVRPDDRWPEYGPQSGAYCCRITWGGDNINYYHNYMVTYGRDGGMVRGTWFYAQSFIVNCAYSDNVLKAVLETPDSEIQGGIVHTGDQSTGDAPIRYSNNRIISNFCNVRLGEDYYAAGCNAEFYDNTFVREGPERSDYRTIGVGYGEFTSTGHKFYDSIFEPGAGYDQVRFDGWGQRNFSVGWTLTVQTNPGAEVMIKDAADQQVYHGFASSEGVALVKLFQYLHEPGGKIFYTPHEVTVKLGGESLTQQVDLDAKKTIDMHIGTGIEPLAISAWRSAGNHAGVECLLEIPDTGGFCECRSSGVSKLVLTFSKPIQPASLSPGGVGVIGATSGGAAVDLSGLSISTSTRNGGLEGVITFSPPLPDFARYYVRVDGLVGTDGALLAGDVDRTMTALAGDVSGDWAVTADDLNAVRAARSAPISPAVPAQVRADVSCDRKVNATDLSRVRARLGRDASYVEDPDLTRLFYQEQGGFVQFAAEGFHRNTPAGGHQWQLVTSPPGYQGSGAMQALPNDGATVDTGYVAGSCRLDYNVTFLTTGTYYVWLRGFAAGSGDDTCHVGLDLAATPSAERMGGFDYGQWTHWDWQNYSMSNPRATLTIGRPGMHTISIYMREDGLILDTIVLTTQPGWAPGG